MLAVLSLWLSVVAVLLLSGTSSAFLPKGIRGFADDEEAEGVTNESKEESREMVVTATNRNSQYFRNDDVSH